MAKTHENNDFDSHVRYAPRFPQAFSILIRIVIISCMVCIVLFHLNSIRSN